jgi:hypothetical protein
VVLGLASAVPRLLLDGEDTDTLKIFSFLKWEIFIALQVCPVPVQEPNICIVCFEFEYLKCIFIFSPVVCEQFDSLLVDFSVCNVNKGRCPL